LDAIFAPIIRGSIERMVDGTVVEERKDASSANLFRCSVGECGPRLTLTPEAEEIRKSSVSTVGRFWFTRPTSRSAESGPKLT
jgi:hypothetical protein